MFRTRSLMAVLLGVALGLSACATDVFPPPRPQDQAYLGLDEGLITREWDGGYPLRFVAFLLNPIGIVGDLILNQPFYMGASLDPELFGYTNQDELYRKSFQRYRYSWQSFGAQ